MMVRRCDPAICYHGVPAGVCRSGTKDDADEIFQEVFFRYLKNQPVFESEEHCKAWLIRVTINCSRKLWSSAWRRRVLLVEEDLAFESKETADLYHELQSCRQNTGR